MAVAAVVTVLVMGAEHVIHDVEETVVVVVVTVAMVEIMIVVVGMRGSGHVLVHGMPRRPDGLEGHEPHEEDQERTTHGTQC